MGRKLATPPSGDAKPAGSLAAFACPNPDCGHFNRFDAGNLSVVERTGKHKDIRRLYGSACQHRFTERQGTLLRYSKLPDETVVRIVKGLGHGGSIEATADICEVDPRTVDRLLERAGPRGDDFHRQQLDRLAMPPEAVQLDELHGRVSATPAKKGAPQPTRGRRGLGRVWVHAALAVVSRFVIDLRVGTRDLATAAELVASVAVCVPPGAAPPLMLIDNHLPYPSALLQVFGEELHRRRKRRHGRKKHAGLKPPAGFLCGVVHKVRDAAGSVVKVRGRGWFGTLKAIKERVVALEIGTTVNTSHLERLNGTLRCQQARLARRPRCVSREGRRLQWSRWLWHDLDNGVRVHGSREGRTPARAAGLAGRVWSVLESIQYPLPVDDLTRAIWAEEREKVRTSAIERE